MKKLLTLGVIILSLCYPFIIYWGLHHYEAKWLLPLLLVLLACRWLVLNQGSERKIVLATSLMLLGMFMFGSHQLGLKFYPVMMNLGFLILFASSLFTPTSFVEKLARLKEPNLSLHAVAYTRKVTILWCGFFVFNGSIAALTALYASHHVWMMYNGLVAYLLMGLFTAGEWIVRQRVKKKQNV